VVPNQALHRTAATVDGLPGRGVAAVAVAAELDCSFGTWIFIAMINSVELTLDLIEQGFWGFHFCLTITNLSPDRLLLPHPEIHGLRFVSEVTRKEAEWDTCLLVSAKGVVIILNPGECRKLDWRVRPWEVERPGDDDGSDYYRWGVDVSKGAYVVSFSWKVDGSYFDPDSHMELKDLEDWARDERARVWLGEALSNCVRVVRAEQNAADVTMNVNGSRQDDG
jgi:hypothetical protein